MFRATVATVLAFSTLASAFSGDGTFYAAGLGACGITNSDTDMIAAISSTYFDAYPGATGNPNSNPICGKQIRATYGSSSVVVAITDRCAGCAGEYDIDFTPSAFSQIADQALGRIEITWEFVDGSDSSGSDSSSSSSAAAETSTYVPETTAAATTYAQETISSSEAAATSSSSSPAWNTDAQQDTATFQGAAAVETTSSATSSSVSAQATKTCNRGARRRRDLARRRSHRAARHLAESH
ncbi:RlpA-like double-psi beta-barrel-protein domain-containing protein-containing protein [Schizophyllum commune]